MSSANSPCAACKFLRRKCMQGCIFAPYFPPDNPARFAQVHRVFGASNVAKLLNDLTAAQREDAVNSLAYEAEARLHDPVYGCVGYISLLQHRLLQLQRDLLAAKKELSAYIRATAIGPFGCHNQFYGETVGLQHRLQHQQQQMVEGQEFAVMMRSVEEQHEMTRLVANGAMLGGSSAHVGGFEGAFAVLQQEERGEFEEKRSLDDGRSGVGPSSSS